MRPIPLLPLGVASLLLFLAGAPSRAAEHEVRSETRLIDGRILPLVDDSLTDLKPFPEGYRSYTQAMLVLRVEQFLAEHPGEIEIKALPEEHRIAFISRKSGTPDQELHSISYLAHSPQMRPRSLDEAYAASDVMRVLKSEDRGHRIAEILAAFDGAQSRRRSRTEIADEPVIPEAPQELNDVAPAEARLAPAPVDVIDAPDYETIRQRHIDARIDQGLTEINRVLSEGAERSVASFQRLLDEHPELAQAHAATAKIERLIRENKDAAQDEALVEALGDFQKRFPASYADLGLRDLLKAEGAKALARAQWEFDVSHDPHYKGLDARTRPERAAQRLAYWERLVRNARSDRSLFAALLPNGQPLPDSFDFSSRHFQSALDHLARTPDSQSFWAFQDIRREFFKKILPRIALLAPVVIITTLVLVGIFPTTLPGFPEVHLTSIVMNAASFIMLPVSWMIPLSVHYKEVVVETATGFGWTPAELPRDAAVPTRSSRSWKLLLWAGVAGIIALCVWPGALLPLALPTVAVATFYWQYRRLHEIAYPSDPVGSTTEHFVGPWSDLRPIAPEEIDFAFAWRHRRAIDKFISEMPIENEPVSFYWIGAFLSPMLTALAFGLACAAIATWAPASLWTIPWIISAGAAVSVASIPLMVALALRQNARLAAKHGWRPDTTDSSATN